ncbi:cyclic peptide export ABC transporter [Paenibacillus sp. FSL H8-0332]|uniref:cyclic peptide export ABC transporter n=1 Tax=Paenibacillus sp. FSL H8-0332 TaxID=2954742 RepID=UPI0030CFA370
MELAQRRNCTKGLVSILCMFLLACFVGQSRVYAALDSVKAGEIETFVRTKMKEGKIPGMTVVIVQGKEISYMKNFGYANIKSKAPVTPQTSFEIASCSKGFTALAILQLEAQGLLKLDDPVSKYFPWFHAEYNNRSFPITLRQLLHHTSGIPWYTITDIPVSNEPNALEEVVRNIDGVRLNHQPGEQFEYATINYAILGAVIERVTGKFYEDYMRDQVFLPLGLKHTTLYPETAGSTLATGYKTGFFQAREYASPTFRGNRPAGYIIMDSEDLAKWLMYQLGTVTSPLTPLIMKTHEPDRTVPPSKFDYSSYAMGWADYQHGNGELSKAGLNPNFSAYMVLRPEDQLAVGIMANNGTTNTYITGHGILDILRDKKPVSPYEPDQKLDNAYSVIAIIIAGFVLVITGLLGWTVTGILRKKRSWQAPGRKALITGIALIAASAPFVYAVFLIPKAMQGVSWSTAIVWSPVSLPAAAAAAAATAVLSCVYLILSTVFPEANENKRPIPALIMLGLLSGVANAVVIFIVNSSVGSEIPLRYLLYYFLLALALYIFGRKIIETKLIKLTYHLIYQRRMELLRRILNTSYPNLEKMDSGRVIATLNNDTELIGLSANVLVGFVTSLLTVICCFIYLGTISFWGTIISLVVIAAIAGLYMIVSNMANRYWEEARDTQNVFMGLIDNMLKGYKELSLHQRKKLQFRGDVQDSCEQYRDKRILSRIKFTNALVTGESLLILILGVVIFFFPKIFPDIKDFTLIKFIIVFLYLIGPINGLMQVIPDMLQIRVSWRRVEAFNQEMPDRSLDEGNEWNSLTEEGGIESIAFHHLIFSYADTVGERSFTVGPVSFEAERGQIIFITGGNGSGKSTLAKLITGLYPSQEGYIAINGNVIEAGSAGEYFSAIFSDFHLFDRIYDIDYEGKQDEIDRYLKMLDLDGKVSIDNGRFSTLKLSGGQRKRLALLICYLEDRPIYLFDEWAADQDPEFRKFFYLTLLQGMRAEGKIVIAITHDDHYFDLADRLFKMDAGQLLELGNFKNKVG